MDKRVKHTSRNRKEAKMKKSKQYVCAEIKMWLYVATVNPII